MNSTNDKHKETQTSPRRPSALLLVNDTDINIDMRMNHVIIIIIVVEAECKAALQQEADRLSAAIEEQALSSEEEDIITRIIQQTH